MKFASKSTTRLATTVLAGVIAFSLAACGSSGGNSSNGGDSVGGDKASTVRVAFLGARSQPYQAGLFAGLESVDGIEATFVDVGYDVAKEVQEMGTVTASGRYDAIVFVPNSATGLIKAATDAIAKDLIVVNVGTTLGPDAASMKTQVDGMAGSVFQSYKTHGENLAKLALEYCKAENKSPCNVARIGSLPQYPSDQLLRDGTKSILDGSATYIQVYSGGFDANVGLKATQDLLAAHPEVDAIAANEYALQGAQQAVKGRDIGLIALGGSEFTLAQVESGGFFGTSAFVPFTEGVNAGKIVLEKSENPGGAPIDMGGAPDVVPPTFTKDTIGSFKAQY